MSYFMFDWHSGVTNCSVDCSSQFHLFHKFFTGFTRTYWYFLCVHKDWSGSCLGLISTTCIADYLNQLGIQWKFPFISMFGVLFGFLLYIWNFLEQRRKLWDKQRPKLKPKLSMNFSSKLSYCEPGAVHQSSLAQWLHNLLGCKYTPLSRAQQPLSSQALPQQPGGRVASLRMWCCATS